MAGTTVVVIVATTSAEKEYPQRNQSVDILKCRLGHYRNAGKFGPQSLSVAERSLFVTPV
jgi:hypothetical protein